MRIAMLSAVVAAAVMTAGLLAFGSGGDAVSGQEGDPAMSSIKSETVEYKHGDVVCEGLLTWDSSKKGKRAAVLVVHDWMGRGDFDAQRSRELAEMGYVAFSADIYGKGVRPTSVEEAAEQAKKYRGDRQLQRDRVNAALKVLQEHELVDKSRIAAIGYCFGGGTVLELARSGAEVAGVVSYHGNLDTPKLEDAKQIKGAVLVLHGADDPYVPWDQVTTFRKEMTEAGVDWQLNAYGNSVHAFTNPAAGDDPSRGAAYNEKASKRAWAAMTTFFDDVLVK